MADVKISALPAVATPAGTDEFAVNQAGTTKKMTLSQILSAGSIAGSFTTISSDGDITAGGDALASDVRTALNTAAGQNRSYVMLTGGVLRWAIRAEATPESGSDAGSDLEVIAYTDAGASVGTALKITRADMAAVFGGTLRSTLLGIGAAPVAGTGILIGSAALSGTTQIGLDAAATFQSTATAEGSALRAQVATAAAAFTMTAGYGLHVLDASKGAGSTITTLYGLYVAQQTQGATNWGVYVANNASYFGGEVQITGDLNHDGTNYGLAGAAPSAPQTGYTTFTNLSTDRTCDADTVVVAELADIVGTLIEDLKTKGIISA